MIYITNANARINILSIFNSKLQGIYLLLTILFIGECYNAPKTL